jgi:D-alanyl-D-alanine dipeptidase
MTMRLRQALAIAIIVMAVPAAFGQPVEGRLPTGLVRLRDIAPDIRQDIRYAGSFNFTGQRVPGYQASECILWRPAAEALARAQRRLAVEGVSLKVYDCYRPARAVRRFIAWSRASDQDDMKSIFYPGLDKWRLFALGYLSPRSKHSLGIAVDAGLVRATDADHGSPHQSGACDGPFATRSQESSIDFGTAFDCLSPLSATASPAISPQARRNRDQLRRALAREGFWNYAREWWHFELRAPKAPTEPFNFPVR